MNISEIHIEHFGVWDKLSLPMPPRGVTVVYGPNEAGKSTLLRFIRGVLYGFSPSAGDSEQLLLESGASGSLLAVDGDEAYRLHRTVSPPLYRRTHVDRPEQLSLLHLPATEPPPDVLQRLLRGVSEPLFRNVFAIELHELQELGTLTGDEVAQQIYGLTLGPRGQRLLTAGDDLKQRRRRLQDPETGAGVLADLFQKLDTLLERRETLRTRRREYEAACLDRDQTSDRIAEIQKQQEINAANLRGCQFLARAFVPWDRLRGINSELQQLPVIHTFPERGVARLDQLDRELASNAKTRQQLKASIQQARQQRQKLTINAELAENAAAIRGFLDQRDWLTDLQSRRAEAERMVTAARGEFESTKNKLGAGWTEQRIKEADTSAAVHQRLSDLDRDSRASRRQRSIARRRLRRLSEHRLQQQQQLAERLDQLNGVPLVDAIGAARRERDQFQRMAQLQVRESELFERQITLEEHLDRVAPRSVLPDWMYVILLVFAVSGSLLGLWGLYTGFTHSTLAGVAYALLGLTCAGVAYGLQQQFEGDAQELLRNGRQDADRNRNELREVRVAIRRLTHPHDVMPDQRIDARLRHDLGEDPLPGDDDLLQEEEPAFGATTASSGQMRTANSPRGTQSDPSAMHDQYADGQYADGQYADDRYGDDELASAAGDDDLDLVDDDMESDAGFRRRVGDRDATAATDDADDTYPVRVPTRATQRRINEQARQQSGEAEDGNRFDHRRVVAPRGSRESAVNGPMHHVMVSPGSSAAPLLPVMTPFERAIDQQWNTVRQKTDRWTRKAGKLFRNLRLAQVQRQEAMRNSAPGSFNKSSLALIGRRAERRNAEKRRRAARRGTATDGLGELDLLRELDERILHLEQLQTAQQRFVNGERRLRAYQQRAKTARRTAVAAQSAIAQWLQPLGLSDSATLDDAHEFYKKLVAAQDKLRTWHAAQTAAEPLHRVHQAYVQRLHSLQKRIPSLRSGTEPSAVLELWDRELRAFDKLRQQRIELLRTIRKQRSAARKLIRQRDQLRVQRNALLTQAGAANREEFEARSESYTRRLQLDSLAKTAHADVQRVCSDFADLALPEDDLQRFDAREHADTVAALNAAAAEMQSKLQAEFTRRGGLQRDLDRLENDNEPAELMFEIEQVRAELRVAAAEWFSLETCERVLDGMRTQFERHQQPATLAAASKYLSQLTGGRYVNVWTPLAERTLRVDDSRGRSFAVAQLSRGTREQLFVAVRLSIIERFDAAGVQLPVILDDIFVNFDQQRTSAAIDLLQRLTQTGQQVLFFTCHQYLAEMFEARNMTVLHLPTNDEPHDNWPDLSNRDVSTWSAGVRESNAADEITATSPPKIANVTSVVNGDIVSRDITSEDIAATEHSLRIHHASGVEANITSVPFAGESHAEILRAGSEPLSTAFPYILPVFDEQSAQTEEREPEEPASVPMSPRVDPPATDRPPPRLILFRATPGVPQSTENGGDHSGPVPPVPPGLLD